MISFVATVSSRSRVHSEAKTPLQQTSDVRRGKVCFGFGILLLTSTHLA